MYVTSEADLFFLFVFLQYWEEHPHPFICYNPYFVLYFIITCILTYTYYTHFSCIHIHIWIYTLVGGWMMNKYIHFYIYINIYIDVYIWEKIQKIHKTNTMHVFTDLKHIKCKTHLSPNFKTSQETKKLKKKVSLTLTHKGRTTAVFKVLFFFLKRKAW